MSKAKPIVKFKGSTEFTEIGLVFKKVYETDSGIADETEVYLGPLPPKTVNTPEGDGIERRAFYCNQNGNTAFVVGDDEAFFCIIGQAFSEFDCKCAWEAALKYYHDKFTK